jgi:hypothetical protein
MTDDRVYGGRYPPKPREVPNALAKELAVLRTLPTVMQIIRTTNHFLNRPVKIDSTPEQVRDMWVLIYEARKTLSWLGAGTIEQPSASVAGPPESDAHREEPEGNR